MVDYFVKNGGSDAADGLSDANAWETVDKVRTEAGTINSGDTVSFNRGDTFEEPAANWTMEAGVTYQAYGSGNKPILEGVERVATWSVASGSVYSAALARIDSDFAMLWEDGTRGTRVISKTGLTLTGTNGDAATTPDTAALSITGDIDIIAHAQMPDWTPASGQHRIVAKTDNSGNDGYVLNVGANNIDFVWDDGSATNTESSTVPAPFGDGVDGWVRVTMDVDNGGSDAEIKFYTSTEGFVDPDNVTWTQLGTTVLHGSTTAIQDGATQLNVGGHGAGAFNPMTGSVYRAIIKNGIDGTVVYDADFYAQADAAASFTENSSNAATVTIAGATAIDTDVSGLAAGEFFIGDKIYYRANDSTDPDNFTINLSTASSGGRFQFGGDDGTIKDIQFSYGRTESDLIRGTFETVQSGWTLDGVVVSEGRHHGLSLLASAGTDITVVDSTFRFNRKIGFTTNNTITNSSFTRVTCHDNWEDTVTSNGLFIHATTGVTVSDSTFYNNRNGLHIASGSVLVEDSVAYDNGRGANDNGGFDTRGTGATFRRCLAYGNGVATNEVLGWGFNTDTASEGTTYEYCISLDNQSHGFGAASGAVGTGHTYYNCIAVGNGIGSSIGQAMGFGPYGSNNLDNLDVRNCIFANNHHDADDSYSWFESTDVVSGATGVTIDNNIYYDGEAHDNLIHHNVTDYATLAAFVAATTFEDNGIESDPLFVVGTGTTAANYKPTSLSPSLNAGVAVTLTESVDYTNSTVVEDPPEMGAYEFISTRKGGSSSSVRGRRGHRRRLRR